LREKRFFGSAFAADARDPREILASDARANLGASLRTQDETFIDSERWVLFIHASSE